MKDIRVAAVVCRCPLDRIDHNLSQVNRWAAAASSRGADIVCFPEMNLCGYGHDPAKPLIPQSIPGSATRGLQQIASRHRIVILAGMAEAGEDGRVYISHLVASPERELGFYRKVHVSPPEQQRYSQGNKASVFTAGGVRFGIQICYDAHFPELSTRMALAGADVIFIPHASPRGTSNQKYSSWLRHLPARAFDNGVFVVACNQAGGNSKGLSFPGLAVVVGPDGKMIERLLSDNDEGMLVADLKESQLSSVREHRMRYFLPNRRPEIYLSGVGNDG